MSLGRLQAAVSFYERSNNIALKMQDWKNASLTYQNLAELHAQLGALAESAEAARQALDLARKAEDKNGQCHSLVRQGWAYHLQGNRSSATDSFVQAETLEKEIDSNKRYIYSLNGVRHAEYLRRVGETNYARQVTESNVPICERNHWTFLVSSCHRVLGDLDFDTGNPESARSHYESALKIARSISVRDVLIQALLARGRFYAKMNAVGATRQDKSEPLSSRTFKETNTTASIDGSPLPITDAFNDLNEALTYAVEGGYRRYEADIRVALGWAWLGVRSQEAGVKAKAEAERALQMSQEMGYHWGKVDAEEVLSVIARA